MPKVVVEEVEAASEEKGRRAQVVMEVAKEREVAEERAGVVGKVKEAETAVAAAMTVGVGSGVAVDWEAV